MPTSAAIKTPTFKEATEDLVSTIQEAMHSDELSAKDREWQIGELDELIAGLKKARVKREENRMEKG